MDRTGSVVTLDPDVDWTVFGFRGLVTDLDAAWRVFADRVTHPTLADEEVARGALQPPGRGAAPLHRARFAPPRHRDAVAVPRPSLRARPWGHRSVADRADGGGRQDLSPRAAGHVPHAFGGGRRRHPGARRVTGDRNARPAAARHVPLDPAATRSRAEGGMADPAASDSDA